MLGASAPTVVPRRRTGRPAGRTIDTRLSSPTMQTQSGPSRMTSASPDHPRRRGSRGPVGTIDRATEAPDRMERSDRTRLSSGRRWPRSRRPPGVPSTLPVTSPATDAADPQQALAHGGTVEHQDRHLAAAARCRNRPLVGEDRATFSRAAARGRRRNSDRAGRGHARRRRRGRRSPHLAPLDEPGNGQDHRSHQAQSGPRRRHPGAELIEQLVVPAPRKPGARTSRIVDHHLCGGDGRRSQPLGLIQVEARGRTKPVQNLHNSIVTGLFRRRCPRDRRRHRHLRPPSRKIISMTFAVVEAEST